MIEFSDHGILGGQKSLRSYWRNYFEENDGVVWVVDSADKRRLEDCRLELEQLLKEEVISFPLISNLNSKKLAGASLLVFANKQDVNGALSYKEISQVRQFWSDSGS